MIFLSLFNFYILLLMSYKIISYKIVIDVLIDDINKIKTKLCLF